jgi:hypothetical protein
LEGDCAGFEIETPTALVRIAPRLGDSAMIEIPVSNLPEPDASTLHLLHRLNNASLLQHDWIASLDDDDQVVLTAVFQLGQTDAIQLEALVADGLERALSLRDLFQPPSPDAIAEPEVDLHPALRA